jgi:hypothetical protein
VAARITHEAVSDLTTLHDLEEFEAAAATRTPWTVFDYLAGGAPA